MAEIYAEHGSTGIIVILFSGMLFWFRGFVDTLINNKMEDLESEIKQVQDVSENELQQNRKILVKLIDRWNKADEARDRRHEDLVDNAERRHEKLTFELRTQSETLNYLKGKLDKS